MKKILSIIIVLIMSLTIFNVTANPVVITPQQAADIAINNVLTQQDKDDLLIYVWGPVLKDVDVYGTEEFLFKTPSIGYIVYIDLYPRANLFHPVQYVYVDKETGYYLIFNSESPPLNFDEYEQIHTVIGDLLNSVENRRANFPVVKSQASDNTRQNRWAVLMNGGYAQSSNHVRYWNDLSNIYIALTEVYDFPDENIIVLCSDGLNPAPDQSNGQNSDPDLDGDGDDDIMYSCVLSNVELVFSQLANDLNVGDKLFIFTTDHGSSDSGWSVHLNLWNMEELTDSYFATLLSALPSCEIICTFEQCYSGGFLDDVVVPPGPIIASSACMYNEYSWAMSNLEYDEYVFHWTAAVKWEDAYGNPVNADYNSDGIISMDEAYEYAVLNDVQSESPQYDDYPEDIGATISLGISNFAPEIPQKPVGPIEGVVNKIYTYQTTTTDVEGDNIYYMWDWGEGSYSDWLGPYESNEIAKSSHEWYEEGYYDIQVKAKDDFGSETDWSEPLSIYIMSIPYLEIGNITGGRRIKAEITNTGMDAIGVNTKIAVDGDFVILGHEKISKVLIIQTNEKFVISSDLILGFGPIQITVEASIDEVFTSKTVDGFIFLFFIIITNNS